MTTKKQSQTTPLPESIPFTPDLSTIFLEENDVDSHLKKLKRKDKLKIVFFGTPEFVVPVLATLDQNFDLVAVVTTPDAPVGRKQVLTPSAIGQYAEKACIPVFKPEKLDDQIAHSLIRSTRETGQPADLFIVASYGKIIPQYILDIPRKGSINIHPSKLPQFRGASPIQSQILEDIKDSAISFILMDAKMDHGPLLHQEPFPITGSDTNETLHDSMFIKAAEVLPNIINDYVSGKIKPIEQDHTKATFCKIFNRESGYFDLDNPPSPAKLDQMIRAFTPWPTAWTKWNGKILKFLPDGFVQPQDKKPMKWKDFLNGYRDFPADKIFPSKGTAA